MDTTKDVIDLDQYREPNERMGTSDITPKIGVTYLPPFSFTPSEFPVQPKMLTDDLINYEDFKNFSWNNPADVAKMPGNLPSDIILPPGNQLSCGSCWAWATVTSLSDNYAIRYGVNPRLGPSYLISCSVSPTECITKNNVGCMGGKFADAFRFLTRDTAGVPSDCWGYQWCEDNKSCAGTSWNIFASSNSMNKMIEKTIPYAPNKNACISRESNDIYKYRVAKDSARSLYDREDIKMYTMYKGPLPAGATFYEDFVTGSMDFSKTGESWPETGGIYVHLDVKPSGSIFNRKYLTVNGDPYPYKNPHKYNNKMGGHAVVIVGWGEQEVPNFLPVSHPGKSTIVIPYWVVRNSWGPEWNGDGYCKVAMTNERMGINNLVKLDAVGPKAGGYGPITFDISHPPVGSIVAKKAAETRREQERKAEEERRKAQEEEERREMEKEDKERQRVENIRENIHIQLSTLKAAGEYDAKTIIVWILIIALVLGLIALVKSRYF